jgi:hypothetical protein
MFARSTSVDAATKAAAGSGSGASVGGVDGSRDGDGGRGRDLHADEGVGDVVDAVVWDGGRVRLERLHVASRGREGGIWRVATLPF